MNWKGSFYQDVITPKEKLKHLSIDLKGKSVIDLGCNIGEVKPYVMELGASIYMGYDANKDFIGEAIKRHGNSFKHTDILKQKLFKADVVFALGLFHHLSDSELTHLISKIDCEMLIAESPILGERKEYNVRSIESYKSLLKPYKLINEVESGFKTPPVLRKILIFER